MKAGPAANTLEDRLSLPVGQRVVTPAAKTRSPTPKDSASQPLVVGVDVPRSAKYSKSPRPLFGSNLTPRGADGSGRATSLSSVVVSVGRLTRIQFSPSLGWRIGMTGWSRCV